MLVVVFGQDPKHLFLGLFLCFDLENFLFLWTKLMERRLGALATNYSPQSRLSF